MLSLFRKISFISIFVFFIVPAIQAKDNTPLGVGFSLPNYPNSTGVDLQNALVHASQVGGHMSFIWSWKNQHNAGFIKSVLPLLDQFNLQSIFQVSPTALGNPVPPAGYEGTFANQAVKDKFLADVEGFAQLKPDYINLCAEINIMYFLNNPEFQNFIPLYKEARDLVKSISPDTKVGVSLLNVLFVGHQQFSIIDELGGADFVGITTYPGKLMADGVIPATTLDQFPREYYGLIRMVFPNKEILVTEVGWSSTEISTPEGQAFFVKSLPWLFETLQPNHITWTLLYDTEFFQVGNLGQNELDILESLGVNPDELFKRFNGMGLFDVTGAPKLAWYEALLLDFTLPIFPE